MGHWKLGAAWKDDKFYHFEPSSIVVMRLWPDMRAWRRTKTKFWVHTRSHADAILNEAAISVFFSGDDSLILVEKS